MKSPIPKPTARRHERPARAHRRPAVLPEDACPGCGTMMRERKAALSLPVNGEAVAVPAVPHLRCPRCRETVLRWEDSRRLTEGAHAIYRGRYGLLSPGEIQAVRRRLGLTQAQFARLLRLGGNTVSRWESGRTVQMAAMDVLLRLVRDVPETVRFLRNRKD